MKGQSIFITGGAGYLGKHLIQKYYNDNIITIYSRDENKHLEIRKRWPRVKCIIGDVADYAAMLEASEGCNIGIFAASLKHIDTITYNPIFALKTIIDGGVNSRRVALKNKFQAGCFISTDKSVAATTLYGAMKYVAANIFINPHEQSTRLSSVVYGNVLNSTGSVIPMIWKHIQTKTKISCFGAEMTRFFIDIDRAIKTIEYALLLNGVTVIPKLQSHKVRDLFDIYHDCFGLEYDIVSARAHEKTHEILIANAEIQRTLKHRDQELEYFIVTPNEVDSNLSSEFVTGEYSSENTLIDKQSLENILKQYNYYKPSSL